MPFDDGLVRLIVRPLDETIGSDADGTATRADESTPPDEITAGSASVGASTDDQAWALDPAALGRLPEGSALAMVGGELVARYPDGSIVDLQASDHTNDIAERPESGDPTLDRLEAMPGVEQVAEIGDGSYAVTVADPRALDGLPLVIADDPLLAIFADPYEGYQWELDNTGDNLDGLAIDPMPPHTEDADIDAPESRSSATGAGVVVAVVDSGVDFSHPDLGRARWRTPESHAATVSTTTATGTSTIATAGTSAMTTPCPSIRGPTPTAPMSPASSPRRPATVSAWPASRPTRRSWI